MDTIHIKLMGVIAKVTGCVLNHIMIDMMVMMDCVFDCMIHFDGMFESVIVLLKDTGVVHEGERLLGGGGVEDVFFNDPVLEVDCEVCLLGESSQIELFVLANQPLDPQTHYVAQHVERVTLCRPPQTDQKQIIGLGEELSFLLRVALGGLGFEGGQPLVYILLF